MNLGLFVNHCHFSRVIFRLCSVVWLSCNWLFSDVPAQAMPLSQVRFNPQTHRLRFRAESQPKSFLLQDPTRIVIDLPDTTFSQKTVRETYPGLVSELRIAQFQPSITRIVLELSPEARLTDSNLTIDAVSTPQGAQWQLHPNLEKVRFPLSQLLQLPPLNLEESTLPVKVDVPALPTLKDQSSQPYLFDIDHSEAQTNLSGRILLPDRISICSQGIPTSQLFQSLFLTIPEHSVFTFKLAENWHYYNNEIDD